MAIDAVLLFIILVLNAVLLITKGTERFEFFDMSAFLDAGYRVSCGQKPFIDFYYNAGPVHLYMHAVSFLLFGFTKKAVMFHLCAVSLTVTALVYVIARLYLHTVFAMLLAALTVFTFYGPICHPWYDQNATLWLMLGVFLWEYGSAFWSESATPRIAAACGILAGISFLTKANVGLAGGVMFMGMFLIDTRRWKLGAIYVLCGLGMLALLALVIQKPADFIDQTLLAYAPGGRLKNFWKLGIAWELTPNATVVYCALVMAFLGGREYFVKNLPRFVLLAGMTFTGLFMAWTSSMNVQVNIGWIGFQFLYLFILARELPVKTFGDAGVRVTRLAMGVLILLAIFNLESGIQYTQTLMVWTWNPFVVRSDYEMQNENFRGWRCSREIGEGLDKTVAYVNANVPKNESLFVFPDATIIYGLTGRDSYRKTPFLFHANQFPTGRWLDEFREHFIAEPPTWIVLHNLKQHPQPDITAGPILEWLKLTDVVANQYEVVWTYQDFSVLRMNKK